MDQKIFILFIIIFLLTTPIVGVASNIIKYLVYLILFISAASYLNPGIASSVREYLTQLINLDGVLFSNIFSLIASFIKNYFFTDSNSNQLNTSIQNLVNNSLTQNLVNNPLIPDQSKQPNQTNQTNQPNQSKQPNQINKTTKANTQVNKLTNKPSTKPLVKPIIKGGNKK
jgi:hypothetical protein